MGSRFSQVGGQVTFVLLTPGAPSALINDSLCRIEGIQNWASEEQVFLNTCEDHSTGRRAWLAASLVF